jgi:tetratricopeptide (TPR) repeat protein
MPTIADATTQAFQAFEQGQLDQAEYWCRQVLEHQPPEYQSLEQQSQAANVLNLLGVISYRTGRLTEAIVYYRAATEANPSDPEIYNNLGIVLQDLGHLDTALAQFEAAIALQPDFAQAHFNFGNALFSDGQMPEAVQAYEQALQINPSYTSARNNLAHLYQSIGESNRAIALYRQSIQQDPNSTNAQISLGNLLQEQGNLDGAMTHYERAIQLEPHNPNLRHNLALAFATMGATEDAIATHYEVLQLDSRHPESHHQLGRLLRGSRPAEALAHLQQALQYDPEFAEAYQSIGQLWCDRQEFDAAIASFQQAIALDPDLTDAQLDLAETYLRLGDYTQGLVAYECRWLAARFLQNQLPRHRSIAAWQGQSLQGKRLLLWGEQNAGLTLAFLRVMKPLQALGATVLLECDRSLVPLLNGMPIFEQVIPRGEAIPACDYQISVIGAARQLAIECSALPAPVELRPQLELRQPIRKIGLAIDSPELHGLTESLSKFDIIQLQGEDYPALVETIGQLDLVIATDNPIAHLAGSLGQRVFLLLPQRAHWLWLVDQADSPWYPTTQLFRQAEAGQWESSIERLLQAINLAA